MIASRDVLDIRFRAASQTDANAIGALHARAWHETYASLLPADVVAGQTADTRAEMWRHILSSPASSNALVDVAECDGTIIGFAAGGGQRSANLARSGFDAEISAIYVLRAFQGRSVGSTLIRRLSMGLLERNDRAVSLWVLRENAPARRFYEWLGGQEIGQRDEPRSDIALVEIAYGWRDLRSLGERPAR